jgi:transposase
MASQFSRRDFLPAGLKANQVELVGNTVRIHSRSAKATAACPRCGTASRHVLSRYRRRPADLPAHGRKVELVLLVRRFRCRALRCPAKIFAERFPPDVTRPHARRTSRLQGLVRHLGLALGGRPAQALAARLLLPVSKDTFLRSIRDTAEASSNDLRVIDVDDWAWRKGQRYGTLISDLERRRVIDLLQDREPATVEAWLRARPGIEVVARDRNGGYLRRQQTNRMVRQMADNGVLIRRIVRQTGISCQLVRQILRGEREDVFRIRESSLTPWLPRLEREWAGGCRNGAELWRRLRADGFQGSLRVVGEWATRQRRAEPAAPSGTEKSPPARKIVGLLTLGRDHLCKADAIQVARVEASLPALAAARRLTDRFMDMVRNAREDELEGWLNEAENGLLGAFARGLRRDQAAVAVALREPWSNGQTEGQINRLKALKRQMYGRANIDLLKARLVQERSLPEPWQRSLRTWR